MANYSKSYLDSQITIAWMAARLGASQQSTDNQLIRQVENNLITACCQQLAKHQSTITKMKTPGRSKLKSIVNTGLSGLSGQYIESDQPSPDIGIADLFKKIIELGLAPGSNSVDDMAADIISQYTRSNGRILTAVSSVTGWSTESIDDKPSELEVDLGGIYIAIDDHRAYIGQPLLFADDKTTAQSSGGLYFIKGMVFEPLPGKYQARFDVTLQQTGRDARITPTNG